MSQHLRDQWRRIAAPARGMAFATLWESQKPEFWVVGDAPPMIGGDWTGYTNLARGSMSYVDALDPAGFVRGLVAEAKATVRSGNTFTAKGAPIHTLYLIARGRGRDGLGAGGASWVVGEMPMGGSQFQPTSVTIRGGYGSIAEPNPRLLHALLYTSGEEARKWIGENLAGVVTDDSMFDEVAQKVTVYRGISLGPNDDPWTSDKDVGGTGSSWSLDLNTAKAIAERQRAGFSSGAQVLGDTYSMDRKRPYVPTVLRAEVTITPPEQNGPAPYRPWTIDYASEAEIDIPSGTEIVLNGVMRATKVDRGPDPTNPGYFDLVTWAWPSGWRSGNVRRTASVSPPSTLYHYTSLMHMPAILDSGHLRLTDSNISMTGGGPGTWWVCTQEIPIYRDTPIEVLKDGRWTSIKMDVTG